MKTSLVAGVAMLLSAATSLHAHRLDEYLQATTISVEKDRVRTQIRLTPGVAVFPFVLDGIDTHDDGVISDAEQRSYAEWVLRDLTLAIDGTRLPLRLVASTFASIAEMKEGRGAIVIDFEAVVPDGGGDRQLTFENRHQRGIAVYLVNALVARDPDIGITAQNRNDQQSLYRLDYTQAGAAPGPPSLASSGIRGWLVATAVVALALLAARRRRGVGEASRVRMLRWRGNSGSIASGSMPVVPVLREYWESDRAAALTIFDSNTPEVFAPEERTDFAAFLAVPAATVLVLADAQGHVITMRAAPMATADLRGG